MALPKNTTKFRQTAPRIITRLMEDFGLADFQAAGFPGNFGVETAGFTVMQEIKPTVKGSKGGLGWAQWTGMRVNSGRRWLFEQWLKRKGAKPDDFEANYGFLWRELTGSEKGVLAPLRKARTVEEAVTIVMKKFERPGVQHLARRIEWGHLALDAFRKAGKLPPERPASVTVEAPTAPVVAAPPVKRSWWEWFLGVRRPEQKMLGVNKGDEVLFRAQNQLVEAGYTSVGDPDGRWGPLTAGAVADALAEQFPSIEPPAGYPLSDEVLAALAKLQRREVSAERAGMTAAEALKRNTPTKAAATVGGIGLGSILTGLGGIFGVPDVVDRASKAAERAGDVMDTMQGIAALLARAIEFVITYRNVIFVVLGVLLLLKGLKWVAEFVDAIRRGFFAQTRL